MGCCANKSASQPESVVETSPCLVPLQRYKASESAPLRVLCVDGGGSKGIGAAKMISMMEQSLGKPLYELYDFVIGSSIGGIVLAGCLVGDFTYDEFEHKFSVHMAKFSQGQSQ